LDKILEGKDLINALRNRHKEMEAKRRKDARKIQDLQQSIKNRDFPCPICTAKDKCDCFKVQLFPENEVESVVDTHTTADWKDIVSAVTAAVGKDGQVLLEPKDCKLVCALKTASNNVNQAAQLIKFEVQIFKSREYQKTATQIAKDEEEEDKHNGNDVHVVRMRRLEGDLIEYRKVRKYLFDTCAEVLTGLPAWALKLQEQKLNQLNIEDENDDYDDLLKDGLEVDDDDDSTNQNLTVSA